MSFKNVNLVLILVVLMLPALAQNNDFGIWAGVKVSKKFNKKLESSAEIQSRFNQNATSWASNFVQLQTCYKFTKFYKLGVGYRFSNKEESTKNRLDIDNIFRHKIENNTFQIRLKYQLDFVPNQNVSQRYRVRFKYSYKINKKFKPYLKAQYFFTNEYDYQDWDQQRYGVGTMIRVAKRNYLDLFYNFDFEQNVANPESRYILGVKYKLEIK